MTKKVTWNPKAFTEAVRKEHTEVDIKRLKPSSMQALAKAGLTEDKLKNIAGADAVINESKEWRALLVALGDGKDPVVALRTPSGLEVTEDGRAVEVLVEEVGSIRMKNATGSAQAKQVAQRTASLSPIDRMAAFEEAKLIWGTRPLQWLRHLEGPRGTALAADVLAAAQPERGITAAFLYTVAVGEGLNLCLDERSGRTKGWINGFVCLGTDTFGTRYRHLMQRDFIPRDLMKGRDFRPFEVQNEAHQWATSAHFKDVGTGLQVVAGLLADEHENVQRDAEALFGREKAQELTQAQLHYWMYVYYNAGKANGRVNLKREGLSGAEAWHGEEPVDGRNPHFNAAQRMAFLEVLQKLKVFDEPGN